MTRFGRWHSGAATAAAAAVAVSAACAGAGPSAPSTGTRFTDAWTAGRFEEVVELFEDAPELARNPTQTFRAGLAYAHPANPARDARRARELLHLVAQSDTTGAVARDAESVLALLDAERAQRLRSDALRREIDALKAIDLDEQESPAADSTGVGPP